MAGFSVVGVALGIAALRRKYDRKLCEFVELARLSKSGWEIELATDANGMAHLAPQAIMVLEDQIAHPGWWMSRPAPRVLRMAVNVLARRAQEAEARERPA